MEMGFVFVFNNFSVLFTYCSSVYNVLLRFPPQALIMETCEREFGIVERA